MPERTCIGCRQIASQDALARMVADRAGRVRMDGFSRGSGRGAYVHPSRACVDRAVRRDSLGRAFKRNIVTITGDALWQEMVRAGRMADPVEHAVSAGAPPSWSGSLRHVEVEQSGTRIHEHE